MAEIDLRNRMGLQGMGDEDMPRRLSDALVGGLEGAGTVPYLRSLDVQDRVRPEAKTDLAPYNWALAYRDRRRMVGRGGAGALEGTGLGQSPDVVTWDPNLLQQPDHAVLFQRGCPPGYFSEFVALDSPWAQPYPLSMLTGEPADTRLSTSMGVRCRLLATTTPQTLVAETGISAGEAANVFAGAVADTVQQIPQNIRAAAQAVVSGVQWLVVGLVAAAAIMLARK